MMNSDGGKTNTMPGMDMSNDSKSTTDESMSGMNMSSNSSSKSIQHTSFKVSGNCEMCKERIETAAKSVKGVSSAVWDDKTKQIHVEFNSKETNLDDIQKGIAKVGHDTEKYKASIETYNTLPECCRYRK